MCFTSRIASVLFTFVHLAPNYSNEMFSYVYSDRIFKDIQEAGLASQPNPGESALSMLACPDGLLIKGHNGDALKSIISYWSLEFRPDISQPCSEILIFCGIAVVPLFHTAKNGLFVPLIMHFYAFMINEVNQASSCKYPSF
jgi:hypothetical protein